MGTFRYIKGSFIALIVVSAALTQTAAVTPSCGAALAVVVPQPSTDAGGKVGRWEGGKAKCVSSLESEDEILKGSGAPVWRRGRDLLTVLIVERSLTPSPLPEGEGTRGEQATLVDGNTAAGTLSMEGQTVRFVGSVGEVPMSQIARVTFHEFHECAPLVAGVVSRDGSVVHGKIRVRDDGSVEVTSARLGTLALKASDIAEAHFECRGAMPAGAGRGALLRNGDFVAAESITLSANAAKMKTSLGDVELPLERVAAVRLAAANAAGVEAAAVLENGDTLDGRLTAASAEKVTIDTALGRVAAPTDAMLELCFPARMAYVSDLEMSVKTQGFAPEGPEYARLDCDCGSTVLKSVTASYRKGLFTRAGAVVTVKLPAGAAQLHFVPEIASGAKPAAGRFAVLADGKEIWAKALDASTKAEAVTVSVAGVREVAFVYVSAPEGLIGSAGVWGDVFVMIAGKTSAK